MLILGIPISILVIIETSLIYENEIDSNIYIIMICTNRKNHDTFYETNIYKLKKSHGVYKIGPTYVHVRLVSKS
jgi:hypothetical protein